MSNYTDLYTGPTVSYFAKLCLVGGVLLHVSVRESEYFGWKGMAEVLPNLIPLVDRLLNYYPHLLCHLVDSIHQTHQLIALGIL